MSEQEKQALSKALAVLVNDPQPVLLELTKMQLWALLCTIQLASRHPLAVDNVMMKEAINVAMQLQAVIAQNEPLRSLAEMGWQAECDVPTLRPIRTVRRTRH